MKPNEMKRHETKHYKMLPNIEGHEKKQIWETITSFLIVIKNFIICIFFLETTRQNKNIWLQNEIESKMCYRNIFESQLVRDKTHFNELSVAKVQKPT